MRTAPGRAAPFLTGSGYIHGFNLIADASGASPHDQAAAAAAGPPMHNHTLCHFSREYWAFPFHEFCWQLLLSRIGRHGSPVMRIETVAASLFGLFHALPFIDSGSLIPDHRYHGTIDLRYDADNRPLLLADPSRQLSMDAGPDIRPPEQKDITPARLAHSSDIFSRLPTELIHQILGCLSSQDVCNVRFSSRSIAAVSGECGLPRSFWASRFDDDMEMGFAYIYVPTQGDREPKSLRQLYRTCKRALRAQSGFEGFRNQKRIWQCVEEFAVTLRILLHSRTAAADEETTTRDSISALDRGSSTPGGAYEQLLGRPSTGCPLHLRTLVPRSETLYFTRQECQGRQECQETMICRVSLMPCDAKTFVSGFQLCHGSEHGSQRVVDSVGYINHSHERSFSLSRSDSVTRIDVVATASGIRGLRFHIRQGDGCSVEAIGYTDIDDSSTGMLSLASQGRILGLLIDFDVSIPFLSYYLSLLFLSYLFSLIYLQQL